MLSHQAEEVWCIKVIHPICITYSDENNNNDNNNNNNDNKQIE